MHIYQGELASSSGNSHSKKVINFHRIEICNTQQFISIFGTQQSAASRWTRRSTCTTQSTWATTRRASRRGTAVRMRTYLSICQRLFFRRTISLRHPRRRILRAGHAFLRVGLGPELPFCIPAPGRELQIGSSRLL